MKKAIVSGLLFFILLGCAAQNITAYKSLDGRQPITFGGDYIIYKGDSIRLGPKAMFIDGQLSDEEISKHPFVFNSVNKAADHLTDGTEESPMVLYIAPYVYWIDDPDDPAIRVSEGGSPPYGKIIKCEWLRFYGLSNNAENVVLACNRGQTIGAQGNFTMFKFIGQGTSCENVTFGNYCSIDLVYPLAPKLGRKKRAPAIVQAQLIHCNGDKIVARNTRFVSRLNLCPFTGGKRVLFDRCHFESTDDALCGTAVYLNCTLDFYGSKPFYNATGTGAVFMNCDIRSYTRGNQFFTKASGQVAVLDTRLTTEKDSYLGWRDVLPPETRNYQYHVTQNGKAVIISKNDPASTVDMSGKPIIDAYRLVHNGKVIYNTYNLLAGDDDWDPMNVKNIVLAAGKERNKTYTKLPVQLLVSPTKVSVETEKTNATLTAKMLRFGNYGSNGDTVHWTISPEDKSFVQLQVSKDGLTCTVVPTNMQDETRQVVLNASTPSGLKGASLINVSPLILAAPKFSSLPNISPLKNGKLHVNYKLDMSFKDQSLVNWYRCSDSKGSDRIEVAVSRPNMPLYDYTLSAGDVGSYIMVSVAPKHIRSERGEAMDFVMKKPIAATDIKTATKILFTDFKNVSTRNQPKVIPGFWTWERFDPVETNQRNTVNKEADAWYYGKGEDGAAGLTGLLQGRSAGMRYTPVGEHFGDMKLVMNVAPFKTAGQGFSIAGLYMDVLIKFDTKTMTGYALRLIRTTKYHDAVDCIFVKYENGQITNISEPVTTTSFITPCQISVEVKNNKAMAHVASSAQHDDKDSRPNIVNKVNMETTITANEFGGFGIQYNGGSPTLIKDLKVDWK